MTRDRIKKRNAEIRAQVAKGVPQYIVAQRFDLSGAQVSRIINNLSGVEN